MSFFGKIKEFFLGKPEPEPVKSCDSNCGGCAPYKVEAPVAPPVEVAPPAAPKPKACGCGRSPSGNCVGLHALSADAWAAHPDNKTKVEPVTSPEPVVAVKVETPTPAKVTVSKAKKPGGQKPQGSQSTTQPAKSSRGRKPKSKKS